ncbi:MAG: 2-polyprenyl-6-methoxyphenol hydroxylase-like oxidoreductase [Chloroflexota bacterium]
MNNDNQATTSSTHAVVIGGSVAGLMTARVLADFFSTVTVIERDILPDKPAFRRGAPQARHGHALLVRGQQVMEDLFPGLTEFLLENGTLELNMGNDIAFHMNGKRMQPFRSTINPIACSRALMEYGLYNQLRKNPRVQIRQQCAVEKILTNSERTRVMGVQFRDRGQSNATREQLRADLVVDASGRGSDMPKWLEEHGYTPPNEITVDAKGGYASRIYRRRSFGPDWKMIYSMAEAPHQPRGGLIVPLEAAGGENSQDGDRWMVSLIGMNGDHPPTDEAGFNQFARSLPISEIYDLICNAEPLGEPYGFQRASNRLREYDKLPRYLEGLLAIGDSVYALNPVYGQGMTVAALGVKALQEVLQTHQKRHELSSVRGVAQEFQKKLARVIAGPWQLATGQDTRWPIVAAEHNPSFMDKLMQRYFDNVIQTLVDDPVVAESFFHVQNMLKEPTTLFHLKIMWRVWQHRRQQEPDQYEPSVNLNFPALSD